MLAGSLVKLLVLMAVSVWCKLINFEKFIMINKEIIKLINYLLEKQANDLKNKLAFCDKDEQITYEQLNIQSKNLAKCFQDFGIMRGDSIAIILPNSVNWIVSCFSILRLGCIVVPISVASTSSEIEYKLLDASCKLIITSKKFQNQLDELITNQNALIQIIYTDDDSDSNINLKKLREKKSR